MASGLGASLTGMFNFGMRQPSTRVSGGVPTVPGTNIPRGIDLFLLVLVELALFAAARRYFKGAHGG